MEVAVLAIAPTTSVNQFITLSYRGPDTGSVTEYNECLEH